MEVTNRGAYLYFMGASSCCFCVRYTATIETFKTEADHTTPPSIHLHPPNQPPTAFQIAVVTIGLNCVTSFFIGNLSNKLSEELEVRPGAWLTCRTYTYV